MSTLSPEESRLIRIFLLDFQEMVSKRINIPFNPRSLTIISQPDLSDPRRFDYVTYNKWFDEMDIQADVSSCNNIIEASLEIPIQILIDAQNAGKPLVSKKDIKKLTQALKLLNSIRIGRQE